MKLNTLTPSNRQLIHANKKLDLTELNASIPYCQQYRWQQNCWQDMCPVRLARTGHPPVYNLPRDAVAPGLRLQPSQE